MSIVDRKIFRRAPNAAIRTKYAVDRAMSAVVDRLLVRFFALTSGGKLSYVALKAKASEESGRWQRQGSDAPPRLTIVIVTYRQPQPLNCLLASLECQTLQCFDVLVLHDGPDSETREVVTRYSERNSNSWAYIESKDRSNDYGHTLRHMGIESVSTDYLLITNGDNYYSPRLVEFMFGAIDAEALDLVMWDMVHSHSSPGGNGNPAYSSFSTYPLYNRADIGAFCVRTDVAKQVGFRDRTHDGDATYLHDLLYEAGRGMKIGKICKVLMVHN